MVSRECLNFFLYLSVVIHFTFCLYLESKNVHTLMCLVYKYESVWHLYLQDTVCGRGDPGERQTSQSAAIPQDVMLHHARGSLAAESHCHGGNDVLCQPQTQREGLSRWQRISGKQAQGHDDDNVLVIHLIYAFMMFFLTNLFYLYLTNLNSLFILVIWPVSSFNLLFNLS